MVHLSVKFIGNITILAKGGNFQPLLYTSLLSTLPTLPTLPTQRKKTLALKAVEFPRVKSL